MPFDFATIGARLEQLENLPAGNERGRALEQLLAEAFAEVPGVVVAHRNVVAGHGEAELDLLLTNDQAENGLPGFGRDILVESKSSGSPLDTSGVNHFVTQARDRNLPWSIIVSLKGITGDAEELRAAHLKIRDAIRDGHGVLVITEDELGAIRSPEHFVNFLEQKRSRTLGKLRAVTLTADELREIDPNRGIRVLRGFEGIENAVRRARDQAAEEIVARAQTLDELPLAAAAERCDSALRELDAAVADKRENPDEDPFWQTVRQPLVDFAAAAVRVLDDGLDPPEIKRLKFELHVSAPQNLDAHVDSDLWRLLSQHYVGRLAENSFVSRRSVIALVSMAIEEMIAIDDIDPRDVYDDYDDEFVL